MSVTLETDHLALRPFAAADAGAVEAHVGRWEVARMTSRIAHPYPEGAAAAWIASHAAAHDEDSEHTFCIDLRDAPGEAMGAASLRLVEKGCYELGYWIAPEHWGKGLATEAAKALVVYGFEKLGAEALESGHYADNPASGRVLEKAGFAANGIGRQWSEARKDFVDVNRFLLTRETWVTARAKADEDAGEAAS